MRLFRSILLLMLVASVAPGALFAWVLVRDGRAEVAAAAHLLAAERVERLRVEIEAFVDRSRHAVEEVARAAGAAPAGRAAEAVAEELARHPDLVAATLLAADGRPAAPPAAAAGMNPADLALHVRAAGEAVVAGARWSEVRLLAHRREAVVTLVAPLASGAGWLAADVSLRPLAGVVASARVGARGEAFVLDARGRAVAHADLGQLLAARPSAGELTERLRRPDASPGAQAALLRDPSGQVVMGAHAVVREPGWVVVAEEPRADALAGSGHIVRSAAVAAATALALALLLSAWFARSLARPVAECVRGALDIARGRFGRQVAVTVRNEVGELAYTFNHMSRELESYDQENRRLIAALEAGYVDTIRSLASAIDAKDPSTRGHSGRVAELAVEIGRELKLPDAALRSLEYGGLLHDVGKIGIPESILHKAGALADHERAQMRAHPAIGAEILRGILFLRDAAPAVRNHHERWDGTGYPDRLRGEEIPLVARIVNAADTFDACTSERPYQPSMPAHEAIAVLVRLRGTQIDPDVCDALVRVVGRRGEGRPDKVHSGFAPRVARP